MIAEHGTQASLRDIARRAGIGLGTLYRHFPTRDALLATLLHHEFEALAASAETAGHQNPPSEALAGWLRQFAAKASIYQGLAASMLATFDDEQSPLHGSCRMMREAATSLLERAQKAGEIRKDITGADLFALVTAVSWISDQAPPLAARREHLIDVLLDGLTKADRTPISR